MIETMIIIMMIFTGDEALITGTTLCNHDNTTVFVVSVNHKINPAAQSDQRDGFKHRSLSVFTTCIYISSATCLMNHTTSRFLKKMRTENFQWKKSQYDVAWSSMKRTIKVYPHLINISKYINHYFWRLRKYSQDISEAFLFCSNYNLQNL